MASEAGSQGRGGADAASWPFLALTLGITTVALLGGIDKYWYPWDEGTLGQTAQGTLSGQLPHRDFADTYTGGLTFFHAAVFWLLGTDLLWLRIAMVPFFMGFVIAVFYLATRLVAARAAALITTGAALWTLPSYPAAIPSWYNLFLGVIGLALVARWLETSDTRHLWLAGLCGGFSIDVKIVGVYYVFAVVLFLVIGRGRPPSDHQSPRSRRVEVWLVSALALAMLGVVVGILRPKLTGAEAVTFLLPVAAVALAAIWAEIRRSGSSGSLRLGLVREILPFLFGVAVPILALAAPYALAGGLGSFIHGALISSQSRFQYAYQPPFPPSKLIWALPLIVVALVPTLPPTWRRPLSLLIAAGYGMAAFVTSRARADTIFMTPLREATPFLAIAAAIVVARSYGQNVRSRRVELLALFSFAMSFMALVQFPFAVAGYFLYVVPLVLLTAVALAAELRLTRHWLPAIVLAAYVVSGGLNLNPGLVASAHAVLSGHDGLAQLDGRRARIDVPLGDASTFRRITKLLNDHARSRVTFAGPDTPEIYYLADFRNATPLIFDFLTPEPERDRDIEMAISRPDVWAVVVNNDPEFSPPLAADLRADVAARFPAHQVVGEFDVRWRT